MQSFRASSGETTTTLWISQSDGYARRKIFKNGDNTTQTDAAQNKVFTSAVNCKFSEDNISYENINEDNYGFIAVYAGKTKAEADKFLEIVKAINKFPGANLRRSRIVLSGD